MNDHQYKKFKAIPAFHPSGHPATSYSHPDGSPSGKIPNEELAKWTDNPYLSRRTDPFYASVRHRNTFAKQAEVRRVAKWRRNHPEKAKAYYAAKKARLDGDSRV